MGWQHSISGGQGNLIATSFQSPGFVAGSAGWQVRKDGSVEFNNGTFRGTVTAGTFAGTDFVINSAGEFYYSSAPAAGNLIYSVSQAAGTDAEGNAYLAGSVSYLNSGGVPQTAEATFGGDISYYTWTGANWAIAADIAIAGSPALLTLTGINGIQLSGDTQAIGTVWADTWHNITSFSTGFSGATGSAAPQYTVEATGASTGSGNLPNVRLRGEILLTGATAADAQMFTLPFTFARNSDHVTPNNLSGYTAGQRVVRVAASGAVRCEPAGSNTNFVLLDGIVAPRS